jgi:hypothetical protein
MEQKDFTQLDARLDLDNQMKGIAEAYPKNEDDFMFFFRGKISTEELFCAMTCQADNFGMALVNLALNNNDIKQEIMDAARVLSFHK